MKGYSYNNENMDFVLMFPKSEEKIPTRHSGNRNNLGDYTEITRVIPFDKVDGLCLNDVIRAANNPENFGLGIKTVFFNYITNSQEEVYILKAVFKGEDCKKYNQLSIDSFISKMLLEEEIPDLMKNNQDISWIQCFLERYSYSHEEVREKIEASKK